MGNRIGNKIISSVVLDLHVGAWSRNELKHVHNHVKKGIIFKVSKASAGTEGAGQRKHVRYKRQSIRTKHVKLNSRNTLI
jgi:hypothetical protein